MKTRSIAILLGVFLLARPLEPLQASLLEILAPLENRNLAPFAPPSAAPTSMGKLDLPMGTGGVDAMLSVLHGRALNEQFGVGAWIGVRALGLPDDRGDIARQTAIGGGIVVRMNVSSSIVLKAQWASHAPIYDSALSALSEAPGIPSFGGSVQLSEQDIVDVAVLENWPNGGASPDFSFGMTGWRVSL